MLLDLIDAEYSCFAGERFYYGPTDAYRLTGPENLENFSAGFSRHTDGEYGVSACLSMGWIYPD